MRASRRVPATALAAALSCASFSATASASAVDEAKALYDEGIATLRKARAPGGDVVHGSHEAIARLEKAAALLGEPRDGSKEAEFLQNVNSLIFWTRRTTPLDMATVLRGSAGYSAGGGSHGASSSGPSSSSKPSPRVSAADAAKALAGAEAYARSHGDDLMTCAARFFEIADRYKDVHDVAFKAISRAQEFQRRAAEGKARREAEARYGSLSPDEKLVVEGDRAYAVRKFDEAAAKYASAAARKATAERWRKLGHARFERAYELRVEYSRAYMAAYREYLKAKARKDAGGMNRARGRVTGASAIAQRSKKKYEEARAAFASALNASGRVDLDSELHIALTHVIRKEPFHRQKAKSMVERILRTYHDKLATDEDRTLYALAETFAGAAVARRIKEGIARRAAASAGRAGVLTGGASPAGADGLPPEEKPAREMSKAELVKAHADLKKKLTRDEVKLKASQLSGRFDRKLLDLVNAGRKRLKELEAELTRRGLR